MTLPPNRLKRTLARGWMTRGLWLSLASPEVAELAGHAGFDWCLIDAEHGPNTLTSIAAQLRALEAAGCAAVVRVPSNDPVALKQVLDLGARSVMVPLVETAEEAEAAVAACRYPPRGRRGVGAMVARASRWGQVGDYIDGADDGICVIVQAETRAALRNISPIAKVEGVDAVFIGPADLAADMGHPGAPDHPEVRALIEAGVAVILSVGKAAGCIAFDAAGRRDCEALGVTFLGMGADATVLAEALGRLARAEETGAAAPDDDPGWEVGP